MDIEVAAGLPCDPTKKICLPGFICTIVYNPEPPPFVPGLIRKGGGIFSGAFQSLGGAGGKANKGFFGAKAQVIHFL